MDYQAKPRLTFTEALQMAFTEPIGRKRRQRARRSEYWWCMLACALYVAFFIGMRYLLEDAFGWNISGWLGVLLCTLLSIPPIGLFVLETYGRLHDTNHRDTWLFTIIFFWYFCLLDSDKHENDYGPSPKYDTI